MYAENWLTGETTIAMEPEQLGAYVNLMCYCWLADPPCTIPDNDKVLAYVSKLGTRWKRFGAAVKACFVPLPDDPKRLREPHLWLIYQEREAFRRGQSAKGKLGGRPKADKKPKVSSGDSRDESRKNPSVSVSVSSSVSKEQESTSPESRRRSSSNSSSDNDFPLWKHRQFRYKADKITVWIEERRNRQLVPGDADFEVEFRADWGMSYDYWIRQSEAHESYYSSMERTA